MKRFILSIIVTLFIALSTVASASVIPAWTCNLTFHGSAHGFQVIVGRFNIKALGDLICLSPFEEVRNIPVRINMSTKYIGPRVAMGSFDFAGEALNIALLTTQPEDLLGRYVIAGGQAAFLFGGGAMTAVHSSIPDLNIQVSMQLLRGFGINLGLTQMTITER